MNLDPDPIAGIPHAGESRGSAPAASARASGAPPLCAARAHPLQDEDREADRLLEGQPGRRTQLLPPFVRDARVEATRLKVVESGLGALAGARARGLRVAARASVCARRQRGIKKIKLFWGSVLHVAKHGARCFQCGQQILSIRSQR